MRHYDLSANSFSHNTYLYEDYAEFYIIKYNTTYYTYNTIYTDSDGKEHIQTSYIDSNTAPDYDRLQEEGLKVEMLSTTTKQGLQDKMTALHYPNTYIFNGAYNVDCRSFAFIRKSVAGDYDIWINSDNLYWTLCTSHKNFVDKTSFDIDEWMDGFRRYTHDFGSQVSFATLDIFKKSDYDYKQFELNDLFVNDTIYLYGIGSNNGHTTLAHTVALVITDEDGTEHRYAVQREKIRIGRNIDGSLHIYNGFLYDGFPANIRIEDGYLVAVISNGNREEECSPKEPIDVSGYVKKDEKELNIKPEEVFVEDVNLDGTKMYVYFSDKTYKEFDMPQVLLDCSRLNIKPFSTPPTPKQTIDVMNKIITAKCVIKVNGE